MFLIVLLYAGSANAEFSFYTTRPSRTFNFLFTESREENVQQFFGLSYHRLNVPVLAFETNVTTKDPYIDDVNIFEISYTKKLNDNWYVGVDLAYFNLKILNLNAQGGVNDLRLVLKHQTTEAQDLNFTTVYEVFAPTGNDKLLLSSHGLGLGIIQAMSFKLGDAEIAANAGVRYSSKATFQTMDRTWQVPLMLGANYKFSEGWGASAEGLTSFYPNSSSTRGQSEFVLNFFKNINSVQLSMGGGISSLESEPESQYRLYTGLKFIGDTTVNTVVKTVEVKTVEKIKDCSNQAVNLSYVARPLTDSEMANIKQTPYLSSAVKKPVKVLNLGQMTGVSSKGFPYAKNSQIVAAFDIFDLPPRKWVQKLQTAMFKVFVSKASKEPTTRTEMFCFLGFNICSGEVFQTHVWTNTINPKFFSGKDTPNDYFSRQYLNKSLDQHGAEKIFAGDLTLDMAKLLENSMKENPLDVLYDPQLLDSSGKSTMYIVVTDDTFIGSDLKLEVALTVNTCEEAANEN